MEPNCEMTVKKKASLSLVLTDTSISEPNIEGRWHSEVQQEDTPQDGFTVAGGMIHEIFSAVQSS